MNASGARTTPVTKDQALEYVKAKCSQAAVDKYKNYAATNFPTWGKDPLRGISAAKTQESWARYKKWGTLLKGGPNGDFSPIEFYYTEGTLETGPTLVDKGADGAKSAIIRGFGQCDSFCAKAWEMLKVEALGKWKGKAPLIASVGANQHNWVIVNCDASEADRIYVDIWRLALGVPYENAICGGKNGDASLYNAAKLDVRQQYDPNTNKLL